MNINTRVPRLYDPYRPQFSIPFHESIHFGGLIVPPPPPPPPQIFSNEVAPFANSGIDWTETPEAHVFKAELPGLRKEEVKVEVDNNRLLRIIGERKVEKEEKSDAWHRVECSDARFVRCYGLPENARADKMKACMENGVLTVTIPKKDVKFNRQIRTIQVT